MFNRKKYKFILVTLGDPENPNSRLLSLVGDKKQADEYIIRQLCAKHDEHFYPWARCHNLHPDLLETQVEYVKTVLKPDDLADYHIAVGTFTRDQLTSLLRLAYGCPPVGASFEFPEEHKEFARKIKFYKYLEDRLPPDTLQRLTDLSAPEDSDPFHSKYF